MLFNSYLFIFGYWPVVVFVFFAIGRRSADLASAWLAIASILFYSWWNWHFTFILLISIAFNYGASRLMIRQRSANDSISVKHLLAFAVAANLAALAYYKYMSFFVTSVDMVLNSHLNWQTVVLPIGISFFTFTQIAFLVDTAQGKATEVNLFHYILFVSYFPHLIAGPILHHSEMIPQFREEKTYSPRADSIAVGLTVFAIGLFKKVILADSISTFADRAFSPLQSASLSLVEAWAGALAYTFQIYFDFSGYTDMAIGISRLFNIRLPANFESPYQS
jgi:alginate O-acetyltransferase complex protein AlgI